MWAFGLKRLFENGEILTRNFPTRITRNEWRNYRKAAGDDGQLAPLGGFVTAGPFRGAFVMHPTYGLCIDQSVEREEDTVVGRLRAEVARLQEENAALREGTDVPAENPPDASEGNLPSVSAIEALVEKAVERRLRDAEIRQLRHRDRIDALESRMDVQEAAAVDCFDWLDWLAGRAVYGVDRHCPSGMIRSHWHVVRLVDGGITLAPRDSDVPDPMYGDDPVPKVDDSWEGLRKSMEKPSAFARTVDFVDESRPEDDNDEDDSEDGDE